jgi:DUF1009 family protein
MTSPLGLIAGGGDLPRRLAAHVRATGRDVFILSLRGFASPDLLASYPGAEAAMGEIGKAIKLFREAGCSELVFAGTVTKPDISALRFDLHGMSLVPQLAAAAGKGDDALLRVVVGAFEKAGFTIIGADDILAELLAPAGAFGRHAPSASDWADLRLAASAALELGANDIGQGAVARAGAIIAREAQDGTDAMLSRLSRTGAASGVLVKRPKPQQERRIDLPTIGVATVEGAVRAGLAGIAVEAQGALVIDRDKVAAAADAAGLFVYGFTKVELA